MQRAAVTIRVHRVRNADADYAALAIGRVRSHCFGDRGAAGIRMAKCHYVIASRGHPRNQDRRLVGFGPGTGEEALLQISWCNLCDFFGQCHDMFVGIQRGSVLQAIDLCVDLAGHLGVAVADRNGQDAAEEIQILAAFEVPQILHFAAIRHQRPLVVIGDRRPQIFFVLGDYLIAARRRRHRLGRSRHNCRPH